MKRTRERKLIVIMLLTGLLMPAPVLASKGKKQFKQGQSYETEKQFDKAADAYLEALGEDPDNLRYRIAYQRTATRASVMLVRRGRELMEQGQYEEAYNSFRRAHHFDATNVLAEDLAKKSLKLQQKTDGVTPVPVPETPYGAVSPPLRPVTGNGSPQGGASSASGAQSEPSAGNPVKELIVFRNQKLEDVISDIARQLELNVMFDSTFRSQNINVELRNVTLGQALDTILRSHQLFFEPVYDNTIIIAADNTTNRARLQDMSVRTFYLKGADPQNVQSQISALFGNRVMVVPNAELRSLTVRTTPETLKVVASLIRSLDKEKPEVLIDISIYEVSRNDLKEIGNQLLFDGFSGGNISALTLNTLGATMGQIITHQRLALAIPSTVIRLLQQRGNSRLIDSLQVHALDGQPVTANVGQQIPIQTASLPSSFTQLNPNQPQDQNQTDRFVNSFSLGVPQIEYRDVGLNVSVTPTIYTNDDIKLEMEIETSGFLAGPTELTPVFTRRNLQSVATVKTGQAAMMAGVAQKRQTTSRTSLPVLGFLPIIGRFFSIPSQSTDTTDLIITVTPHIIRSADITDEDRLAMEAGKQVRGVSESIEGFLKRRDEKERQRRPQEASQPQVTQVRPPSVGPPVQGARPVSGAGETVNIPGLGELVLGSSAERMGSASPLTQTVSGQTAGRVQPPALVEGSNETASEGESASVLLQTSQLEPRVGELLKVAVFARSDQLIQRGNLTIHFNPQVLKLRDVIDGDLLSMGAQPFRVSSENDPAGALQIAFQGVETGSSLSGQTALAVITFEVLHWGKSALGVVSGASRVIKPDGTRLNLVSMPVAISAKK